MLRIYFLLFFIAQLFLLDRQNLLNLLLHWVSVSCSGVKNLLWGVNLLWESELALGNECCSGKVSGARGRKPCSGE